MTDYDELQTKMTKAFALVQPKTHWKDPIDAFVSDVSVESMGIDAVRESVIHFTGTVPSITRAQSGYHIKALGYRAGPCGDS